MIQITKVRKTYGAGEHFVIDQIDLDIREGEFLVMLGESGCGKTTLLKMINRLIPLTDGTIEVDGRNIMEYDPVELRRHIGYVFQDIGLFPHMSIASNVGVVPQLLGWKRDRIVRRVDELLELVGLDPDAYRHRRPGELSGGQRQRVGVARALAAKPKIMLMDEPFGALDPITRDDLQREYRSIHDSLGLTTVMVTHDMSEALIMGDRIAAIMDGKIIQIDTPHVMLTRPGNEYIFRLMEAPRRQADTVESLLQEAGVS